MTESEFNSKVVELGEWLTRAHIYFGPSNGGDYERTIRAVRRSYEDLGKLPHKAEMAL